MILPLQIQFHNTKPIEDLEFHIRRELAELEKFYNRLVSCRVDVELPEHPRKGSVSEIRIDFGVPVKDAATRAELRGGVESKQDTEHLEVKAQRKDATMAVHAAFNIARRRLEELTEGSSHKPS
jgi:Sigma 54 modulation protein / S30EA ribosomal protein